VNFLQRNLSSLLHGRLWLKEVIIVAHVPVRLAEFTLARLSALYFSVHTHTKVQRL